MFGRFLINNRNPCSLLKIRSNMDLLQRVMSKNQIAEELLVSLKSEVIFFSLSQFFFSNFKCFFLDDCC